jgi:hypothetical protein
MDGWMKKEKKEEEEEEEEEEKEGLATVPTKSFSWTEAIDNWEEHVQSLET